jgi:EAL domain-containing protein (putative c-di-GMP-specific phosphodiesterase class I)
MMQHASKTIATLQSIKDFGILIYIDDFGTGYSSLAGYCFAKPMKKEDFIALLQK